MKDCVMPFGRYKGQLVSALPENYVRWIVQNVDPQRRPNVVSAAKERCQDDMVITFGRYNGSWVSSVPREYLTWMADNLGPRYSELIRLANYYLTIK